MANLERVSEKVSRRTSASTDSRLLYPPPTFAVASTTKTDVVVDLLDPYDKLHQLLPRPVSNKCVVLGVQPSSHCALMAALSDKDEATFNDAGDGEAGQCVTNTKIFQELHTY